MDPADEVREFAPDEIPAASNYIHSLPTNSRVYVDVWADGTWDFAFFDDQRFAAGSLSLLRPGQHFRVRATYPSEPPAQEMAPRHPAGSKHATILVPPPRKHPPSRWRALRNFFKQLLE